MTTFTKIGLDSLLLYINKAFEGDHRLFSEYHVNPGSFHDCAADTYNQIIEVVRQYEGIEVYGINHIKEGILLEKIGFAVLLPSAKVLYSFGINKVHRTDNIKALFLNFVNTQLGSNVALYLYEKNVRAIEFFKRNNYKETAILTDKGNKVIKLESCQ